MEKEKSNKCKLALIVVGGVALTVAGFIIIPPIIKKYSKKLYKKSLKIEDIKFEDMGPEIIPFEKGV